MTIVTGTATVDQSGRVVLDANTALGFGTARGVRLSNFTSDTVIIHDISGQDQSEEYLTPQTQMVYATDNVGQVPWVVGYAYGSEQIAAGLLVEWSTDPLNDFIGTYPIGLPTGYISKVSDTGLIASYPSWVFNNGVNSLGTIASDYVLINATWNMGGSTPNGTIYWTCSIWEGNNGASATILMSSTAASSTLAVPIRLAHTSSDLSMQMYCTSSSLYTTGSLSVYALPTYLPDMPYTYFDVVNPAPVWESSVFAAGTSTGTMPLSIPTLSRALPYMGPCTVTVEEFVQGGGSATGVTLLPEGSFANMVVPPIYNAATDEFVNAATDSNAVYGGPSWTRKLDWPSLYTAGTPGTVYVRFSSALTNGTQIRATVIPDRASYAHLYT